MADAPPNDMAESPRIAALRQRLEAGDHAALGAFWEQIEADGAPLVESLPDHPDLLLLTFVYRGTADLRNVAVFPGLGHNADPRQHLLEQVDGTDVWYRTYCVRSNLRAAYHFSLNDPLVSPLDLDVAAADAYAAERAGSWVTDPLNPRQFALNPAQAPQSYVELPDAPRQPYLAKRDGVPEGRIDREDLARDPFGEGRRIWTYLPPGYDATAAPYPLVLQFDGLISRKLALHTTLDNMIAEGVIPPVVGVMMHSIDRNVELPCNEAFAEWVATAFLPMWRAKYAITDDPAKTVVTGMSYGGLAAAWCGLRHPEVFGNVLSQSGSYWWRPEGADEWQWLTPRYEASPRLPLRFYMNVGLLEDGKRRLDPSYPSMVEANRALCDVLGAKGYDVEYDEFNGGHDYVSWRGSIADGLAVLLGGRQ